MVACERVRCSALDRVMTCSGSLMPCEYPLDYPLLIGATGTAGHAAMARIIAEGVDPETAIDEVVAADSSLDRADVDFCVSEAVRAWRSISGGSFTPALVEVPLQSRLARGIADVVRIDPDEALVIDWKMGHGQDRHDAQLMGYASGVIELVGRWPSCGYVRTVEVHVRHGQWFERHVTPAQLAGFHIDLERRIANPGAQWAPGRVCIYCPRRCECEARAGWLRDSVALLGETMALGPTRETMAQLYPRAEAAKAALEQYWSALNSLLDDGPLDLPDGRVAQWGETRREEIDLARAWPILRQAGIDVAEILGATRIGKGALRTTIEASAPRGEKKKRSAALFDALREAHAVKGNIIQRRDVRVKKDDA